VREHPNVGAQELVQLARKQGLSLTPGHIYNIRAADKSRAVQRVAKSPGKPVTAGRRRSAAVGGDGSSSEDQLRNLVIRVGLDRAHEIFEELKTKLY